MRFDARKLGEELKELAVDVVSGPNTDIVARWYHADCGPEESADLVVWTDGEDRLIKFQLCALGQVIEWNPIDGTRTGVLIEQEFVEPFDAYTRGASEIIRFDREPDERAIQQALEILSHASAVPALESQRLLSNLSQSPRFHPHALRRALGTWSGQVEPLSTDRRPSFWRRARHLLKTSFERLA